LKNALLIKHRGSSFGTPAVASEKYVLITSSLGEKAQLTFVLRVLQSVENLMLQLGLYSPACMCTMLKIKAI
jgi:hypothetical protein